MIKGVLLTLSLLYGLQPALCVAQAKPNLTLDKLKQLANQDPHHALELAAQYLQHDLTTKQRLEIENQRCQAWTVLTQYEQIHAQFKRLESVLLQPGNEADYIDLKACYARTLDGKGRIGEALTIFNELLILADAHHLTLPKANVLLSRGQLRSDLGHYALALEDINLAHQLYDTVDTADPLFELLLLNALGNVYSYMKQYDKAFAQFELVQRRLREQKDDYGLSVVLYNVASLHIEQGQYGDASEYAQRSRALAEQGGDKLGMAYADIILATVSAHQGDYAEASAQIDKALETFVEFDELEGIAKSLLKKAGWLNQQGHAEAARPLAQQALERYRLADSIVGQIESHKLLAEVAENQQDSPAAIEHLHQYIALSEQQHDDDFNRRLVSMQAEFDSRAQHKENLLLQAQNDVRRTQLEKLAVEKRHTIATNIALVMVVVALVMVVLVYRRSHRRLRRLARTDGLTGLLNRRAMMERLEQELQRAKRYGELFTVALFDADHFKQINDNYGHHTGDKVLKQIAAVVQAEIRGVDVAARFGGEEFLLLLPQTDEKNAAILLERIRASIEAMAVEGLDEQMPTTVSIGYLQADGKVELPNLLQRADYAMYVAKSRGRNTVVSANEADADFAFDQFEFT